MNKLLELFETNGLLDLFNIFFKKYRKNKTAYESAEKYLEEDMNEMDYLDSIKAMMENNAIIEELDEIRAELIQEGYLKPEKQNKKNPKKNEASMPFSPFFTTSAIASAILSISSVFIPRVVTAGVPRRIPLVTNADFGSLGMVFLLAVI